MFAYKINILGECIALWGKRKQVLLCGRCCCTFVCKWYNSKRLGLCRLRNRQSLEDHQSSQAAPAILSRLQQSFVAGAAEEQPTCQRVGTLSQTRVAGFDTLAVALICYVAWGGLPSCPRTLLRSPAFPPVGNCVRLGRTGIRKPTEVCRCVNLVCGGFKHTNIYI